MKKQKNPGKPDKIVFLNFFVFAVIAVCLFGVFTNIGKISQRRERLENLEREHKSLRIKNDSLKNRLETSREKTLDENYIIDFARENGLRKDSEILFYLYPEQ
ncbi:MAG: hypothetical protein FWH24_00015 [Oscillospiraceae bacterium]|nr:hypothetical protein [Oscillospiraceae bacterium]